MTEYNNDPNAAFDGIVNHSWAGNPQASAQHTPPPGYTDPHPYGPPAPGRPRTGLTPRGKAGIAVVTAVLAGGGLLGYSHYSAVQAANQVAAQKLAIEQQKLDLQKQKALDKANQAAAKTASAQETARQKKIDACVQANKGLVGKQLGQTLPGVISDCQDQYPASANTGAMQEAASTSSTGGGGASPFVLAGVGALGLVTVVAVRKGTRSNPA